MRKILYLLCIAGLVGCTSYYVKTIEFQEFLLTGQFEKASHWLDGDKKGQKPKNLLLHKLNRGYVERMNGELEVSRQAFHESDLMIEDYRKTAGNEALAILLNPKVRPFKPESFESLMLHYYQALNYLDLQKYEDAVVECRRMNMLLQKINEQYKDHKPKYQRDAFAHTLMGLIYESRGKYNDAFIAYRNAYEIYKEDYGAFFKMSAPEQLKLDMLRTAHYAGLYDLRAEYEKEFGLKYIHKTKEERELVLFWETGWSPYKEEWSVNFYSANNSGVFSLYNEELGLNFAFHTHSLSTAERGGLASVKSLRVAFPKFVERKPVFNQAWVINQGKKQNLEEVENVNEIAFKSLRDRMMRELGNALLRLAVRKGMEAAVRSQNGDLGALVGLVSSFAEQADTRYWQALPYSIHYTRIPLTKGQSSVQLVTRSKNGSVKNHGVLFSGEKKGMQFVSFRSLETY